MSGLRIASWQVVLFAAVILAGTSKSVLAQARSLSTGGNARAATGGTQAPGIGAATGTADVSNALQSLNRSAGTGSGSTGSGFVGRGDSEGRLVGRQQAGQQGNSRSANQPRNFNNRSATNFNNRSNSFNRFGRSTSRTGTFRPVQKIAFSYPRRATSTVSVSLKARFDDLSQLPNRAVLDGVSFDVDDAGMVTLRGTVDSERSRRLAMSFVRLEPGVRSVKNELTVNEADTPE